MSYNGDGIEAIRFGARLGRVGIGCCGLDLIQGFSHSPYDLTTFPLRYGDEDTPIFSYEGSENEEGQLALHGTNLEVLKALLTVGTHDEDPKYQRSFLATISHDQLKTSEGEAWLRILAELGFEFIRAFENGVYGSGHWVYLFGYFRNSTSIMPVPPGWDELPKGAPVFNPADFEAAKTILEGEF